MWKKGVLLLLALLLIYLIGFSSRREAKTSLRKGQVGPFKGYKNCNKVKKIAFLKTHKCASSTVQNILMRFGVNHNLNFVLPSRGNYLGRYTHFRRNMIGDTSWEQVGMDYNIFCLHTIWDYSEVNTLLGKDTYYITIMRDPVDLFESLWGYSSMHTYYGMSLEDFALAPKEGVLANRAFKNLGRNQMLWDSGLPARMMDNMTAVHTKIKELENTFDLVMMAENFEESMVLLKDLLCWDYRDVTNFKLNARKESIKTVLSDEVREALKQYLSADYTLYNHFKQKFNDQVEDFGRQKMKQEVDILKHANDNVKQRCSLKPTDNDKVQGENKLWGQGLVGYKGSENEECSGYTMSEMNFIDHLRTKQSAKAYKLAEQNGIHIENISGLQSMGAFAGGVPDIEKLKAMYIHSDKRR